MEQLILPLQCRKTTLQLAHDIPLAGHMGKEKTARRVLQRFYWPTLYRDVAEYCRSCGVCQKSSRRRVRHAPLISLPIVEEPLQRIAMDIVGPLHRSRSGNRYILVICDYATRYPEAVPLKSIDAEHIAEELVKLFARVGVALEILTDHGSKFTLYSCWWRSTGCFLFGRALIILKQMALLRGLITPSRPCSGRLLLQKGRTGTSSYPTCCLRTGKCLSPPQAFAVRVALWQNGTRALGCLARVLGRETMKQ